MAQAEAPQFIYTEAEREEMLRRMVIPYQPQPLRYDLGPATRGRYFHIKLLDKPPGSPQEEVVMKNEEGILRWRVCMDVANSVYSAFLGKKMKVYTEGFLTAIDPLTDMEHATLAKRLVAAYQEGLTQPS